MFKLIKNQYFSLETKQKVFFGFGTRKFSVEKISDKVFLKLKREFKDLQSAIFSYQAHQTKIKKITSSTKIKKGANVLKGFDGFITERKNLALVVFTADCVPIIYYDEKLIGVSHQGWRGTLENFSQKMINSLVEAGAKLKSLKVVIGPSIGECCYDIPISRAEKFEKKYPHWAKEFLKFSLDQKKVFLNLLKLNYLQLLQAGVSSENVSFFPFCTVCDRRFISFRRTKSRSKNSKLKGLMINFISKF